MTAARRKRKQIRGWYSAYCAGVTVVLAAGLAVIAPQSRAIAATERIVVDWHTGLAINGYDPVAFFTDGKPLPGSPEFELRYGGAVWRFCNPGNRDAFIERPDVYMPRYGGYDPLGIARGVAVAGNPNIWLIAGERLFLFYDRMRLEKFAADPDRAVGVADRKWPDLKRTLTP
jgi:YHS domain-containing protein